MRVQKLIHYKLGKLETNHSASSFMLTVNDRRSKRVTSITEPRRLDFSTDLAGYRKGLNGWIILAAPSMKKYWNKKLFIDLTKPSLDKRDDQLRELETFQRQQRQELFELRLAREEQRASTVTFKPWRAFGYGRCY
jgi:hypothetical protein